MTDSARKVDIARFAEDLAEVIPDDGRVIVLHSGLMGFAGRLGVAARDIPAAVLEMLLPLVGGRTLVMPAYSWSFPRTRVYDRVRTRPDTGAIVEAFLKVPGVRRSNQPVNSYAVLGPEAETILSRPCTTAWGRDSAMGWFYDVDARFVSLGVGTLLSNSYYHTAEEWERVPYRYFKRFVGELHHAGEVVGTCAEVMYLRPLGMYSEFLGTRADELLGSRGRKLRPSRPDGIVMESMTMRDTIDISQEVLREDPYVMVKPQFRQALKEWVEAGNLATEVSALPEDQRFDPDA